VPARKIQDEQEILRWFADGWTYEQMCDEYRRKYNIETVPSLFGNFRVRRGLPPRIVRDDELIPWAVREEHRWAYPLQMLRLEARHRATGEPVRSVDRVRHENFMALLKADNVVVDYDPETGFHLVPREPQDGDLPVRRPKASLATHRHTDR